MKNGVGEEEKEDVDGSSPRLGFGDYGGDVYEFGLFSPKGWFIGPL